VRRSSTGRVRVDRAVGSRGRSSCPRANPERNQRFRRVATFRPVAKVRAAAVPKQVTLNLKLPACTGSRCAPGATTERCPRPLAAS
jgi:hypothetical protein